MDLDTCPLTLDLLLVPGGPGQLPLMEDERVLAFIRRRVVVVPQQHQPQQQLQTPTPTPLRYLCSVCTGSLVLAATGLLQSKRGNSPPSMRVKATTHWLFLPCLEALGVEAVADRVVWCDVSTQVQAADNDGTGGLVDVAFTLATGGGVTAGIDFALDVVKRVYGAETALGIQLAIQYDPEPPARMQDVPGSVRARVEAAGAGLLERRWAAVNRIRARLGLVVEEGTGTGTESG